MREIIGKGEGSKWSKKAQNGQRKKDEVKQSITLSPNNFQNSKHWLRLPSKIKI